MIDVFYCGFGNVEYRRAEAPAPVTQRYPRL